MSATHEISEVDLRTEVHCRNIDGEAYLIWFADSCIRKAFEPSMLPAPGRAVFVISPAEDVAADAQALPARCEITFSFDGGSAPIHVLTTNEHPVAAIRDGVKDLGNILRNLPDRQSDSAVLTAPVKGRR